ncbi:DoxX family protein [Polaribacter sp. WD7]|uniref:DoxX family protein n=1 Tax=Polaribacter sp. WD7 TaxID=2269061 RepID=UPI000DF1C1D2|nr:DoxX family protein [Polaribacter sp. WD7]RCS27441.1 DoxX family protein [Polaribacter sp. WD7]
MKAIRITYYIATGLLTLLMLFSAGMYFFNHEEVAKLFTNFGYPTYIIYPYAILKISGIIVIWFAGNRALKEWAYSGFFFAFLLAFFAHVMTNDGEQGGAIVAIILLLTSYFTNKKLQ